MYFTNTCVSGISLPLAWVPLITGTGCSVVADDGFVGAGGVLLLAPPHPANTTMYRARTTMRMCFLTLVIFIKTPCSFYHVKALRKRSRCGNIRYLLGSKGVGALPRISLRLVGYLRHV